MRDHPLGASNCSPPNEHHDTFWSQEGFYNHLRNAPIALGVIKAARNQLFQEGEVSREEPFCCDSTSLNFFQCHIVFPSPESSRRWQMEQVHRLLLVQLFMVTLHMFCSLVLHCLSPYHVVE